MIDIKFNMQIDARGGDPDSTSPTLKSYHKILWNKPLPNGKIFELSDSQRGAYLYHNSELGEFFLGSDSITHSYRDQKKFKVITEQVPKHVNELYNAGSTIGAFILFPNKRINGKHTINQARGINALINDRFDLTLECIRRSYKEEKSPLYETILRYNCFFDLFETFEGYVNFFLLNDLLDNHGNIKFYLPFDEFKTRPQFNDVSEYLVYKKRTMNFIDARSQRMKNKVKSK